MKIEVSTSQGRPLPGFVVHAESATDRAILGMFTNSKFTDDLRLQIGGTTYSCDVSGTVAFNFGWVDWPCPRCRKLAPAKVKAKKAHKR